MVRISIWHILLTVLVHNCEIHKVCIFILMRMNNKLKELGSAWSCWNIQDLRYANRSKPFIGKETPVPEILTQNSLHLSTIASLVMGVSVLNPEKKIYNFDWSRCSDLNIIVIKHHYQKQYKEERIYLPYGQNWGKQRQRHEAGTWRPKLKQKTCRNAAAWFAQPNFLYDTGLPSYECPCTEWAW